MSVEHDCLVRDDGRCFRCGEIVLNTRRSCHHRKLRSAGGGDGPENRLTLCGTGTTGCHGNVHREPRASRASGYLVSRYAEPADVPVAHYRLGWVYLTADGGIVTEAERDAREEAAGG